MEQPPVTWLLSVRNSMPYLPLALESIASQTYRNHGILAWDDCSADGSLEVLNEWIPKRIPGKIFSERSLRLGACLAFLVEQAETELLARMDGDDIALPNRLELQVQHMLESPTTGVLGSQIEMIDEAEHVSEDIFWFYETEDADIRWGTRWGTRLCHPSIIFRRSVVLAAGNYADVKGGEDGHLWLRASSITEIRKLPETLTRYRRIASSITGQVTDYVPDNRITAQANWSHLFPNIRDEKRAMNLWNATNPYLVDLPAKFRHLRDLEQAAVSLARKVGKPDDYFKKTDLYQRQYDSLWSRTVGKYKLEPVARLRANIKQSLRGAPK